MLRSFAGRLSIIGAPRVAAAVNRADRDQNTSLGWWWATVVSRPKPRQAASSTMVSRWKRRAPWLVLRIWLPKPAGVPIHLRNALWLP